MHVEVRPAHAADAGQIVDILNPIIEAGVYTAFDTPFSVDAERHYIETLPARGIFHVAVAANRIVGFQSMEPFATYTHAPATISTTTVTWKRRLRRNCMDGENGGPTLLYRRLPHPLYCDDRKVNTQALCRNQPPRTRSLKTTTLRPSVSTSSK